MNKFVVKTLLGMSIGALKLVNFYALNSDKVNFVILDIFAAILCFV